MTLPHKAALATSWVPVLILALDSVVFTYWQPQHTRSKPGISRHVGVALHLAYLVCVWEGQFVSFYTHFAFPTNLVPLPNHELLLLVINKFMCEVCYYISTRFIWYFYNTVRDSHKSRHKINCVLAHTHISHTHTCILKSYIREHWEIFMAANSAMLIG